MPEAKRPEARNGVGDLFWVISDRESLSDILTVSYASSEVLPVFSFFEEAELFLWLGGYGARWRVRQTALDELVSVLLAVGSGVGRIALDPLPEVRAGSFLGLLSVSRERFIADLLGRGARVPRDSGRNNGHLPADPGA